MMSHPCQNGRSKADFVRVSRNLSLRLTAELGFENLVTGYAYPFDFENAKKLVLTKRHYLKEC